LQKIVTLDSATGKTYFECGILKDTDIIRCVWSGDSLDFDLTKNAANSIVRLLKQTGFSKVLDDNRKGFGDWPDLAIWLKTEWMQALKETNLTSYAHVLSPDFNAKLPAYDLFNQTTDGIDFVTFDSFNAAYNWLKNR